MRDGRLVLSVVIALLAVLVAGGTIEAQQIVRANVSVTARVVQGTFPVNAALEPAEFEVPAGTKAVNLRYLHSSGMTNLGCQVYSITEKSEMCDRKKVGFKELPAGKYRFSVGGLPGAIGTLTYDIVRL